ncbi:hypothetical protein BGZ49_003838, partial [Haplosporangium sp. Z 27]
DSILTTTLLIPDLPAHLEKDAIDESNYVFEPYEDKGVSDLDVATSYGELGFEGDYSYFEGEDFENKEVEDFENKEEEDFENKEEEDFENKEAEGIPSSSMSSTKGKTVSHKDISAQSDSGISSTQKCQALNEADSTTIESLTEDGTRSVTMGTASQHSRSQSSRSQRPHSSKAVDLEMINDAVEALQHVKSQFAETNKRRLSIEKKRLELAQDNNRMQKALLQEFMAFNAAKK